MEFWARQEVPDTLLHDPASSANIDALETRLNVFLADDFKESLRVTNGFGAGDQGIYTGVFPDPNLRPSGDIKNIDCEDQYSLVIVEFLSLPLEIQLLIESGHPLLETPLPPANKLIELGQRDIISIWLVPPERIQAARPLSRCIEAFMKQEIQSRKEWWIVPSKFPRAVGPGAVSVLISETLHAGSTRASGSI